MVNDIQTTTDRLGEAEGQTADIEQWTVNFKEALSQS